MAAMRLVAMVSEGFDAVAGHVCDQLLFPAVEIMVAYTEAADLGEEEEGADWGEGAEEWADWVGDEDWNSEDEYELAMEEGYERARLLAILRAWPPFYTIF